MDPKQICRACRYHWRGEPLKNIAKKLNVAPATVSRWKNTDEWKTYAAKLLDEWHQETKAAEGGGRGR